MDFLQKKTKRNEGEVPQYYVENDHPAIIDPETFDLVQAEMERKQKELRDELQVVVEITERCVAENARIALDQNEYNERYNGLVDRYTRTKAEYDAVTEGISDKESRRRLMEQFAATVAEQGPIAEFDERLWSSLVDFVTIYSKEDIRFTFRDGTVIRAR